MEISDGVNLGATVGNKIVGIEILNASKKLNLKTILSCELQLNGKLVRKTADLAVPHEAGRAVVVEEGNAED